MSHIFCYEFNEANMKVMPFEQCFLNKNLLFGKLEYKYPSGKAGFVFQTPFLTLSKYGIPSKQYKERNYIKVPLDPNFDGTFEMNDFLSNMDKAMRNIDLDNQIKELSVFKSGSTIQKNDFSNYTYNEKLKADSFKVKFSKDYKTDRINTTLFVRTDDDDVPENVQVNSLMDIEKYLGRNSKFRMVIRADKIWVNAESKKYGVSFSIVQLDIISGSPIRHRNYRSEYYFKDKKAAVQKRTRYPDFEDKTIMI